MCRAGPSGGPGEPPPGSPPCAAPAPLGAASRITRTPAGGGGQTPVVMAAAGKPAAAPTRPNTAAVSLPAQHSTAAASRPASAPHAAGLVCFNMPSCGRTKGGRVEIEEVAPADAYADRPPPYSPAEDAAADAGACAPATVAGAAAELANSPLAENEEADVEIEEVENEEVDVEIQEVAAARLPLLQTTAASDCRCFGGCRHICCVAAAALQAALSAPVASTTAFQVPRPSWGTAANVDWGIARAQQSGGNLV